MPQNKMVVVAMSGGVDSSVAAALLKEEGYRVVGVTMQIWPHDSDFTQRFGGCCGVDAIEDAKKVSFKLGIPHYVVNFRDIFEHKVIADFCREYSVGRTPNPCIRCNQYIKFGALWDKAKQLGADFIATGHYARIETDQSTGACLLKKGLDKNKDQSYFLYILTQEQLRRTLFPLGNLTKDKVRDIAARFELPVAQKPGSQEICFILDKDYHPFLKSHITEAARQGTILDKSGEAIGTHPGIIFFTVGQRHGLGLSGKGPLYVIDIKPEKNAVVVGEKKDVYGSALIASDLSWIGVEGRLETAITVKAKIRYRQKEAEATVTPVSENEVCVRFKEPQWAISPGQAVVLYDGDVVIGGGTIERKAEANE